MPADPTNAREQLQAAVRESLLAQPHATSWIVGETLASVPDVIWDAILALPPEAPIAPTREALIAALTGWPTPERIADALLASPNLWESRAEIEAGALEAAADELHGTLSDPERIRPRVLGGLPTDFQNDRQWAVSIVCNRAAAIRSGVTK